MKLVMLFVCMALTAGLMAQNVEFSGNCPASIDLEERAFGRNMNLKVLPDNNKLILFAGLLRTGGQNADAQKRPWLSDLIFFSPDGKRITERQFPGLVYVDKLSPTGGGTGYYLVTKSRIGKHDDYSSQLLVFDGRGNEVYAIPDLKGRSVIPAVAGDGIMIAYVDIGAYGRDITLAQVNPPRGEKMDKAFSVKVDLHFLDQGPSGFVYLGGTNMDYVVSMGGTVWRESGKTQIKHWKIQDVGDEITGISMSGSSFLKVDTHSQVLFVDIRTGRRIVTLDVHDPAWGHNDMHLYNLKLEAYKNGQVTARNYGNRYHLTLKPAANGASHVAGVRREKIHHGASLPFRSGSYMSRKMGKEMGNDNFYGLKVDGNNFILFSY